jgi:hypothetical protein
MTASVITRLEADFDAMLVGLTPFKLELKGVPETRIKVEKIQDQNNGKYSVRITAPIVDGKPVVPFPTLDQVARRIIDGAKVAVYGKNSGALIRTYSA